MPAAERPGQNANEEKAMSIFDPAVVLAINGTDNGSAGRVVLDEREAEDILDGYSLAVTTVAEKPTCSKSALGHQLAQ